VLRFAMHSPYPFGLRSRINWMGERLGRVVAFVVAHPDDDVMGAAGYMALNRNDPELRFVLIHATDGDAGEIAPGVDATRATLGAVRRGEDEAGWQAIGRIPDRHEWLGLPDGGLADLPDGLLESMIGDVFGEERPDIVMTFGPDGITGHPDHIAVGAAASAAFMRLAGSRGPGFHRLFHGAYPQSALDRVNTRRESEGRARFDPTQVYQPRGVPDVSIGCSVDLRALVPLVTAAFREHRSQWVAPWSENSERDWVSAAGALHMVQAWPVYRYGSARLSDPFQGLTEQDPPINLGPEKNFAG
jgi:N-acetyl-1-D-myo-inositol-2-amino-2-deoxy-alpha-D-glucopyranoside deacetylase